MPTSVLLADDHPLVVNGLKDLLEPPEFEVVAACSDGGEALRAIRELRPELAILDLRLPQLSALEIVQSLRRETIPCRTVLLTASVESQPLRQAERLGFDAVVTKDISEPDLLAVVRRVRDGGPALPMEWSAAKEGPHLDSLAALTKREREIALLAAQCQRNKQIAHQLSITEGTVKLQLHNVYRKLGISSRVELVEIAYRQALI